MLVLSRRKNESIIIDNGTVKVTVIDIRGDKVRLGFVAPDGIEINREEVQEVIDRDGKRKREQ